MKLILYLLTRGKAKIYDALSKSGFVVFKYYVDFLSSFVLWVCLFCFCNVDFDSFSFITHLFPSIAVLDTAAGVWCDTKSVVTSPRTGRYSADAAGGDASVELTRRCRHAAAAVGDLIFIYGGLRGGKIS